MRLTRAGFLFFVVVILSSCAIKVPPDGGPQDLSAPRLVSSKPENYSTSFSGHDIQLDFDEFISINNISSQLIISPLLKNQPETKIRKKSLLVHIEDTLLENTTYTINFGEGVADNNEGNKLANFQFVFSTGPILDSLKIDGRVTNAFDKKTSKGILALLYRDTDDSLPYLQRPVYFSTTNDSGFYRINNISPGSYKMIALKESDGNYLYLQGEEMIGFPDSLVNANSQNVNVKLFKEIPQLRFLRGYSEFPGKANLVFSAPADTIKLKWLSDSTKLDIFSYSRSQNHDTLTIWYKNILTDTLSFHFDNGTMNDTVTLRLFRKQEESVGRKSVGMTMIASKQQTAIQHLYLPYYIECNHPIAQSNFDKIIFLEDSSEKKPKFRFTDSLKMKLSVEFKWKPKAGYSLFIPPGTFTDIYGVKNDTVQLSFNTHGETDYGSLKVIFQGSNNEPFLIQLIDDAEIVYREIKTERDTIVELTNLDPKIYRVKLIHDKNRNGKWDTGNYLKHIQPDEIEYYQESITVRANWDVDLIIKLP